ncbi:MAG TPA: hypothetical protein VFQ37_11210, partial [Mycobacterium sp.]|nr:hypothetical protein [Mycobacterium sp.]
AVRSAADTMAATGLQYASEGPADPRLLVEQLLEASRQHRIPDHAPSRAVRVLQIAAHVDAIVTVSGGLAANAAEAVGPLAAVVRSARTAAVDAILCSAWRG